MRIRSGFVSNSSSSSFCILGRSITSEEHEMIGDSKSKKLRTEASISCEDEYYAGAHPEDMKDEETLLQFKQRIVDEFKAVNIPTDVSQLDWHTDGGYNG